MHTNCRENFEWAELKLNRDQINPEEIYYRKIKMASHMKILLTGSNVPVRIICALTVLLLIAPVSTTTVRNVEADDNEYVPSPIYFLRVIKKGSGGEKETYLVNQKPDDNLTNIIEVDNEMAVDFSINMIGKVYDEKVNINLLLSMISKDRAGKEVHIQLLFDYDNDGIDDTIVNFTSYTTVGSFEVENVTLWPANITGELEDFPGLDSGEVGGKAPGGTTTLRIWRSDGQNDSNLVINCGANNRASWANIPYYEGAEGAEGTEEDGFIVGILVGVVLVLGGVYLFLKAWS